VRSLASSDANDPSLEGAGNRGGAGIEEFHLGEQA